MADHSSPEIPKPMPANTGKREITTRRRVVGAILGLAGIMVAGKPREASAQTLKAAPEVKPNQIIIDSDSDSEDEKTPKRLKEKVDNALEKAGNYLKRQNIGVKFSLVGPNKPEGNSIGAYSTYETVNPSGVAGNEELSDYKVGVYYQENLTEGDEEYLALRAAAEIAKITNRKSSDQNNLRGYIVGKFSADFKNYTGFDIESLDSQSAVSTPVIMPMVTEEAEFRKQLKVIFDFMNYTDGRHRADTYEQLMDTDERMYTRGLALWLLKSDELVKRVQASSYQPQARAKIANVFLSILKQSSSSVPLNIPYEEASAVDQENLDKMLELSGDPKLREFFQEKRQFSGVFPKAA
jgi:hypothetical protein